MIPIPPQLLPLQLHQLRMLLRQRRPLAADLSTLVEVMEANLALLGCAVHRLDTVVLRTTIAGLAARLVLGSALEAPSTSGHICNVSVRVTGHSKPFSEAAGGRGLVGRAAWLVFRSLWHFDRVLYGP